MSRLLNLNVYTPTGGRTSIRIEKEVIDAVDLMAKSYGQTRSRLITLIQDSTRPKAGERTSAIRVEVLLWALGKRVSSYHASAREMSEAQL